jgi:hypothetical protein
MTIPPVRTSVPIEEIVDRDEQLNIFERMVAGEDEKRLMFVRAEIGYGTSCLLQLMEEHCQANSIPCCYVDFWSPDSYDAPHLTLAREICEQLGLVPKHLADAVRPLSTRGAGGKASTVIYGNVTDSHIVTQVLFNVSLTEELLHKGHLKQRLKRAFADDLSAAEGPLICLFDTFENVSSEEEIWLLEALFQPVRDGKLKHVVVVTGGIRTPRISVWEWKNDTHLIKDLPPLTKEHIRDLGRRLGRELSDEDVQAAWRFSQEGIPQLVGMLVKNLMVSERGASL